MPGAERSTYLMRLEGRNRSSRTGRTWARNSGTPPAQALAMTHQSDTSGLIDVVVRRRLPRSCWSVGQARWTTSFRRASR
jgi:hypothetical protein